MTATGRERLECNRIAGAGFRRLPQQSAVVSPGNAHEEVERIRRVRGRQAKVAAAVW